MFGELCVPLRCGFSSLFRVSCSVVGGELDDLAPRLILSLVGNVSFFVFVFFG